VKKHKQNKPTIFQKVIRAPYNNELIIISNQSILVFLLKTTKSLQTRFAALALLAEGQVFNDELT
jgi:hypothetical protein